MFSEEEIAAYLPRIDTASVQQQDTSTRILVVWNPETVPYSGPVRFRAAFPVRAAFGRRPVTVRDVHGMVVPSHLTVSELTPRADLPEDKVLWTLELEFLAVVPARGWRSYAATYGYSAQSRSDDTDFWEKQAAVSPIASSPRMQVVETVGHSGDLPATFSLAEAEE
jgi:hypothetical protein